MAQLSSSFYTRPDVVGISRELLGKFLLSRIGGRVSGGMIVETEAYGGVTDRASHAYGGRRTRRTEVMYARGGVAYVYLCYGIHSLFNIITNEEGVPHAVLVRALEPTDGIDVMLKRREMKRAARGLTGGPGALSAALAIHCGHSGASLLGPAIWLEDRDVVIPGSRIQASPRVGVDYAGDDAKRPWRFRIKDNPWTSPAR